MNRWGLPSCPFRHTTDEWILVWIYRAQSIAYDPICDYSQKSRMKKHRIEVQFNNIQTNGKHTPFPSPAPSPITITIPCSCIHKMQMQIRM